mgnify:CR=1 FL=1
MAFGGAGPKQFGIVVVVRRLSLGASTPTPSRTACSSRQYECEDAELAFRERNRLGRSVERSGMERLVRERTGILTALLTIVSLALVFGAVLRVGPATALPAAPDSLLSAIPHVNALISATAIGTIVTGIRAVRRGEIRRHQQLMVTTFGLFAAFLVLYLYRVSLVGPTDFAGPAVVETFVYLPILAIHILLAIVCVPFVFYALLLAATRPYEDLYHTRHAQVGSVAAVLWLISFTMGIGVYLMLYHVF